MKSPEELRKEFWQNDISMGGGIHNQYIEIKKVLENPNVDWINRKILELKKHAIKNVPFYKKYRINDVFPVVNKRLLLENYDLHKAICGFDEPIHISSTSGSTGIPFSVLQDKRKRQRTIADLKVFGERCEYPSHERLIYFRATNKNRTKEQEDKENIYYVDSNDLSDAGLEKMVKSILEIKPRTIFAYSSVFKELVRFINYKGLDTIDYGVKSLRSGGEALEENVRKELERIFNCKVYRRYSDMELGILAQDMGDGSSYELNYGSYYFECLKIDSDEQANDGEVGRIVITDLFNYAFPMIRYDTGDLGIMSQEKDGIAVLSEIWGRQFDCLYTTEGKLLSAHKLSALLWDIQGIKQIQIIQNDEKEYLLKLNIENEVNVESLIDKLKSILGLDANISIEYVDEIPVLHSNKRRWIIRNYNK